MPQNNCTVFNAAELLGKKWTLPVLYAISKKPGTGFNQLAKSLGTVRPKMLSGRLKQLEHLGAVQKQSAVFRRSDASHYFLTDDGTKLLAAFENIKTWAVAAKRENAACLKTNCTDCPQCTR